MECTKDLSINPLMPNDLYMSRTAPLTSKRCILYIYSTNVGTEYFKHALYSPFFLSSKCNLFHNANLFGSCIIHILHTGCAEIKKNNSGAKGLTPRCIGTIRSWTLSQINYAMGTVLTPTVQKAGWAPFLVCMGAENFAAPAIRSPDHPAHSESL